ncbi:MAG: GNAT family N-acetyltransferase [Xanthobacteraceae bacterium]
MSVAGPVQPILESERLRLLPITPDHASGLHLAFSDLEVMRYADYPVSLTVEDTVKRMQMYLFPLPEWHATWVLVCKRTGAVMGLVNYHHREDWNRRLEVGFVLARPYWRKGFMGEAMQALLKYCFLGLGMNRVEVTVNPTNRSAIRMIEGLQFQFEGGPLRGRQQVAGEFRDMLIYGLLKHEWRMTAVPHSVSLPEPAVVAPSSRTAAP